MPLNWQTVNIPFSAGLSTKVDDFALEPPGLAVCQNAVFTETGGIQKRLPYTALSKNILGGGNISNPRRLAVLGDELILFTKDTLYSWSARDAKWVSRGTYLAPVVTEKSRFTQNADQSEVERAELGNTVVMAWNLNESGGVYVAAYDKTTGATILAPTVLSGADTSNPRLLALTDKILLFWRYNLVELRAIAIDPDDVATGVASASSPTTVMSTTAVDFGYDVAAISNTSAVAVMRLNPSTSYGIATIDESLTVAASAKARTCDGPIGVAYSVLAAKIAVVRANGTNIQGDTLTSALVDSTTGAAVGTVDTAASRIAVGFRSVANSGVYRCYAFWQRGTATVGNPVKSNWLASDGTVGTQGTFVLNADIASKAFDHGGSVFVWLIFTRDTAAGQNTLFLYKDDATLQAKAITTRASRGFGQDGWVASVQNVGGNTYAMGAMECRALDAVTEFYGAASPREVWVEFDSNAARRTAQIGRTLYVTGGQVLQYDGRSLAELGFHVFPWSLTVSDSGAGSLAAGTYAWKSTFASENAFGELDRSTTAKYVTTAIGASREATITHGTTGFTLRTSTDSPIAIEDWRGMVDADVDEPFYLVSAKDPSDGSGDNHYVANAPTTATVVNVDDMVDATAQNKEQNPENGTVLEGIAPPPASIIVADDERLYLAGIPGDPYAIWPSKLRSDGEVPAFHDSLVVRLPAHGGDITALAFMNNTLIVFKESAIYAMPGAGQNNDGSGQAFGPSQLLSADMGAVSADAVAVAREGLVFFSRKGWCLLDRGYSAQYIGEKVEGFNTDTFTAVHVLEDRHEIRCVGSGRVLMFDTNAKEWSEWTITDGLHAAIWNGVYHYISEDDANVKGEAAAHSAASSYSMVIETAWIKLAGLQGFQRIRHAMLLFEALSEHTLRLEVYRDFIGSEVAGHFQTIDFPIAGGAPGVGLQLRHAPSIQKMSAFKMRITDRFPVGGSLNLTGLALEVGIKRGLNRNASRV